MKKIEQTPEFSAAFAAFVKGVQEMTDAYLAKNNYRWEETITFEEGVRYMRVIKGMANGTQRSVHCFVDKENGDILKAASWKAPAKHPRGNIFMGMGGVTVFGGQYMRGGL